MKPVQMDFVEPRAWRYIWSVAATVLLVIATTTAVKVWQLRQQRAVLAQELVALEAQQLQRRLAQAKALGPPKDNPRVASEAAANRLLKRDWNRLYDTIETPTLSKVRLVQMSVDAATGQVMLEYELDSLAQATVVTQALNDASGAIWQLQRLDGGASVGGIGVARTKGVWRSGSAWVNTD